MSSMTNNPTHKPSAHRADSQQHVKGCLSDRTKDDLNYLQNTKSYKPEHLIKIKEKAQINNSRGVRLSARTGPIKALNRPAKTNLISVL